MKNILFVLTLSIAIFTSANAQKVAYEYKAIIVDSTFEPIKLAINQVVIHGDCSPDDSALARKIFEVINDDIDFYMLIDTVMMDPFMLKLYEVDKPDYMIWKYKGAQHVLDLAAEFSDGKVRVNYSLHNMAIMKETASDSYRVEKKYARQLGHAISDAVVERLTGYKGIFRTRLAFVTAKTGNKEIYISDYDGYNVQPVTSNGSINLSPVWDARGEEIFYTSFKGGKPDIWEVNLRNSEHRLIASFPGINSAPAISPNNKEMLLTLSKDGNAEIYLCDRDGKIKRRLTNSFAIETSPTFTPSGNEIVFTSDRTGGPQIYMMDNEGLNVRRLTTVGKQNESAAVSPDGSKIAYVTRNERGNFDICVADIDGTHYKIITDTGFNENPRWAPDGLHIVYSTQWGDRSVIFISDYMGYKRRLITNQPGSSNPGWSGYLD